MLLADIYGSYDAVVSLGNNCIVAHQLKRMGRRKFSGPVDWVYQPSARGMIDLLLNRFQYFLLPHHLNVTGIDPVSQCYIVQDSLFNMISLHDFPVSSNTPEHLADYPAVKAKYDRRALRLMHHMVTSNRLLFIRTEASFEEAAQLEFALRAMILGDFRLLVINHAPDLPGMVREYNWPMLFTCGIQIPQTADHFKDNDPIWTHILSHVILT